MPVLLNALMSAFKCPSSSPPSSFLTLLAMNYRIDTVMINSFSYLVICHALNAREVYF